jgi:cytochrome c-type biogenesis protein
MAVGGAILIAMGVLVFTGQLTQLNARANELLDSLGLNFFTQV